DLRRAAEVVDHVELGHYRRRAGHEGELGRAGQVADEVDPLAHAAAVDAPDGREVEDGRAVKARAQVGEVRVLVDLAMELDDDRARPGLDVPGQRGGLGRARRVHHSAPASGSGSQKWCFTLACSYLLCGTTRTSWSSSRTTSGAAKTGRLARAPIRPPRAE